MSLILLDELLRACSQDSSNKIKPLFENKADQRSIISKNRIFAYFDILAFFRNKIWIPKKPEITKRLQKQIVALIRTLRK